jgi:phosphoglycerol transferase MdoB-like AlkP superfamily enzyme
MLKITFQILKQFFSFLGILFLGKIIFLCYHFNKFDTLSNSDKIGVFKSGLKLDISISSYLLLIPVLLILIANIFQNMQEIFRKINKYYHLIICIIISCIITIDLELFRTWGIRIDNSPLKYLANPKEMLASSAASPFHILIPILLFLVSVSYILNRNIFKENYNFYTKNKIISIALLLLIFCSLIIPIRGGLQLAPINQSSVYFSKNNFANQAAINPVFNLFHSLTTKNSGENPFIYLPEKEVKIIIDSLFLNNEKAENQLNTAKPNVLIITWESLTSKVLNQKVEVVPNLKKLINEGIFFENCYASGDRSDKGMVSILSGYPAQPITSIINFPQKTAKLPIISKNLKQNGYSTAWYYGGEPEFANMKSYFLNGQFDELITKENFPAKLTENTKWGANDSIVFDRLLVDLNKKKAPFFVNYFTLSSHEPYEVPSHQTIIGNDESSKFLNAHNYTDEQLGRFIAKAKLQPWYKNTLIIIVADHGHRLPISDKKDWEFKIPMLWFGGALKTQPKIIFEVCSQNDMAKSLLNQLNINAKEYVWSKDLFAKNFKPFAYFAFNNGFGFVQNNNSFTIDNVGKQIIQQSGTVSANDIKVGKAYVQSSFADYLLK